MLSIAEAFDLATKCHQAGNLQEAERIYRGILQVDPGHAESLHLLGLIAYQVGRYAAAIEYISRAIGRNAGEPAFHNNLGLAYQSSARLPEAVESFQQAVQLKPDFAGAYTNLGSALQRQGKVEEAMACYNQALRIQPRSAMTHYNLGNALLKQGKYDEAAASYRRALGIQSGFPEAYNNLGNALRSLGKLEEATEAFQGALSVRPAFAEAHNNLGIVLKQQGRFPEAVASFQQALRLQPDFAEAHHNLGHALQGLHRLEEALRHYREALHIKPDYGEAHVSLGDLLWKLGQVDEALEACQTALRMKPDYIEAYSGLGLALQEQGRLAEAQAAFRRALQIRPESPIAHSNLLLALNYDPDADPGSRFIEHCRWAERHARLATPVASYTNQRDPERCLRVGYVSPDFRTHVVARFLEPILANHDPSQVQTTCYAEVPAPDAATGRLQALAARWRSTCGRTDDQVADMIRADEIDILVDLAGHTGNNRLLVFARQPAPLQVTYLGYPNTTGLPMMHYRLTDAVADPESEPARHTEQLLRLPHGFCCYAPPEDAPEISRLPARASGHVTFGSLSILAKLNPAVLDLWCRILRAVPASRLLLFRHTLRGQAKDYLFRQLTERGIPGQRIDLRHASVANGGFHLPTYHEIDVSLDPFPWSGHATTLESLWMGAPVVTLYGNCHAGRLAASVLTQLGLHELIAVTPEEYITAAIKLASDLEVLSVLRSRLRQLMLASPLCDGKAFTRDLEAAYRTMWRRWCTVSK